MNAAERRKVRNKGKEALHKSSVGEAQGPLTSKKRVGQYMSRHPCG